MNSMTGYGKSVAESDGRKITVEMKSVNHRFLDVTVKLPKVLSFAEDAVRRVIIDNFKRGHFDVYVTYENTKNDGVELSVNEEVAKEYLKIKDVLCDKYGVQDDFTVTALMRTADVIETKTVEEDEDALKSLIVSGASGASEQMKKMRAFEGEKLRNDILKKVSVIESTVGEINSFAGPVARMLLQTGDGIKNRTFSHVGKSNDSEFHFLSFLSYLSLYFQVSILFHVTQRSLMTCACISMLPIAKRKTLEGR